MRQLENTPNETEKKLEIDSIETAKCRWKERERKRQDLQRGTHSRSVLRE